MISAEALSEAMVTDGVAPESIHAVDSFYSLPDKAFVRDLGSRYSSFLWKYVRAEEEAQDCDDFAFLLAGFARLDHGRWNDELLKTPQAQESQPPQPTTLAFGFAIVWFDSYGHALNIAVLRENERLVTRLFEPQPINGICLTEIAISSVRRWSLVYI